MVNNYVDNRNAISFLLLDKLYEQALDDMTNQKLDSAFDELQFFNDTILKDPLHFSLASCKIMDSLLEHDYIRTYGFDSFVENYTNLIIEEFDDNFTYLEDFGFEIKSIAESIKYSFSKVIPERLLTEAVEGIDNEDVRKAFKQKIIEAIEELNELRINLKYYKDSFIKNANVDNNDKKAVLNKLKQYISTSSVGVDKFISFMSTKFAKEIDKNNGAYFTDKRNKDEFYSNFNSFQISIAILAVAIINVRVIAGDNKERPGHKIPTTQVRSIIGNKNGYNNVYLWNIIKALNPITSKNKVNEKDFTTITNFLDNSLDKSFEPLLRYFYKDNLEDKDSLSPYDRNSKDGIIGNLKADIISREQSLSFKFVHHLDQLVRGVIDLSRAIKRLLAASQNRQLNEFLTGYDIENIANKMSEFISTSNKFYKDLEIMVISGHADLVNKYNDNIR